MCLCLPDRIGIWRCWFLRRGENRRTRRKTSRNQFYSHVAPVSRFSKVPKVCRRISGDIILFVSSERRHLGTRDFAVIFIFIPFTTYDPLYRISGSEFYEWLFGAEKFSGLSRNRPHERESNSGRIGGRRALSPQHHPCSLKSKFSPILQCRMGYLPWNTVDSSVRGF